jgi:hypothetical protein
MKNKSKKQVEKVDNSNEKLLLSDVIKIGCFGEDKCIAFSGYGLRACFTCPYKPV